MTNPELCVILVIFYLITGCSGRLTSEQASSATSQPGGMSKQAVSVSTQASGTSQADKFFSDPQVRALAAALERNDWAGAEEAVHAGAEVNAVGREGMYPLAWTMYVKNKAAFEWLLNHKADPNFDSDGKASVLFWAAESGDPDWLHMLLAHKANPNLTHKTSIGTTETPLLAAISPTSSVEHKIFFSEQLILDSFTPARVEPSQTRCSEDKAVFGLW